MQTVCRERMCTGCTACVNVCMKDAVTIERGISGYTAFIDLNKCVDCGRCVSVCQQNNTELDLIEPSEWLQGWSNNQIIRNNSTSGGLVTALAEAFICSGGTVCSCIYRNQDFQFDFVTNTCELKWFAGSKYVKSNPGEVFRKIKKLLATNMDILFIGLPCQVEGLKMYLGNANREHLFTIDLICHGTPSKTLFDLYLAEYLDFDGYIKDIKFRQKPKLKAREDYEVIGSSLVEDLYTLSFLKCCNFTDNCYECKFASTKRGADLTVGDSWGSDLPKDEQDKGISLILCQTKKGKLLLEKADLTLYSVDIQKARENNSQLNKAADRGKHDKFIACLAKGYGYDKALFFCYPKLVLKQKIKRTLIGIGIIKPRFIKYGIFIKRVGDKK